MPTRNRLVRVTIELATTIGAESTARLGLKCVSPNHTVSSPICSARSTSSKDSWKASSAVPPGRSPKSRNIPKSIGDLLSWPGIYDRRLSPSIDLQASEGKPFARPAAAKLEKHGMMPAQGTARPLLIHEHEGG